jgi:hypothetical protein
MHGFNAPSGRRVYFDEDFGGRVMLTPHKPDDIVTQNADTVEIRLTFADFEAIAAEYARWSTAEDR